jgi:hypothetical protein
LTINPHTGLAEAGFLQAILPTLLGAGLSMIPGVGPLMAAGLVGGGTALATGDLKKGLMAGLGAYGGAGIYGAMNPAAVATQGASTAAASTAAAAPTSIVPNATALAPIPAAAPPVPISNGLMGSGTYPLGNIPDVTQSVMVNPSSAAFSPTSVTQGTPPTYLGPNMSSANLPSTKIDLGLKPSYTPPAKSFEDALLSRNGAMVAGSVFGGLQEDPKAATPADVGMIRPYTFDRTKNASAFQDVAGEPLSSRERNYFTDQYTALTPYKAPGPEYKNMAAGGPVEQMSNNAAMGANTMYPMANMASSSFATPYQAPLSTNMLAPSGDAAVGINAEPNMQGTRLAGGGALNEGMFGSVGEMAKKMLGEQQSNGSHQYTYDPKTQQYTEVQQGTSMPYMAAGGSLGSYSDGGRMLKGPGDGMSDNIPAVIGKKQPARLADGEFVVPADVVSHLGNGSTDAGAKQLYAMMDKIRAARTGTKKQGKQINPRKYMPA